MSVIDRASHGMGMDASHHASASAAAMTPPSSRRRRLPPRHLHQPFDFQHMATMLVEMAEEEEKRGRHNGMADQTHGMGTDESTPSALTTAALSDSLPLSPVPHDSSARSFLSSLSSSIPFLSPAAALSSMATAAVASPPSHPFHSMRSPNRFTAPTDEDEDEDDDDESEEDSRDSALIESDEDWERSGRMKAYLSVSHLTERHQPFRVEQPTSKDEGEEVDEEEEEEEGSDASHDLSSPHGEAALSYSHRLQALHHLTERQRAQLAFAVDRSVQELDVALALAVGIEPDEETLDMLTQPPPQAITGDIIDVEREKESNDVASPPTSPSFTSSTSAPFSNLIDRSRSFQSQWSDLPRQLYEKQRTALEHSHATFASMQQSHARELASLRSRLQQHEEKQALEYDRSHAEATKARDEQLRLEAEERKRAEAAAKAAREAEEAAKRKAEAEAEAKRREEAAKAEQERKQKEEEAAKAKARADAQAKAEADKNAAAAAAAAPPSGTPSTCPALAAMEARQSRLASCRSACRNFSTNPANKPRRLQVTMLINRTITQIVGTVSQVRAKASVLTNLLKQAQIASASGGGSGEEYAFALELIAMKIVAQGKAKVRLLNSAAFPFATVALFIAVDHPDFNDIFLACLEERCIYMTPRYLDRKNYPSQHAYMEALGYEEMSTEEEGKPNAAVQFETEESYLERMVGYVCLYAAYVENSAASHPHPISLAWSWLARLLNRKPRSATASVLHAFLSTAGPSLHLHYPNQMLKLLNFINEDFLMRLDASTPPRKAAQAVLALWLQTALHHIQQTGRLPDPEGKNMPHSQDSDASQQEIHPGDTNS